MMKFYTDIMGVSAALVGTLMMVAKVVDAFTDVAMGQVVDRSPYTAKRKIFTVDPPFCRTGRRGFVFDLRAVFCRYADGI